MNKIIKTDLGHQYKYNGIWYNFCIKCGIRYNPNLDQSPCVTTLDFVSTNNQHDLGRVIIKGRSVGATTMNPDPKLYICKKCRLIFSAAGGTSGPAAKVTPDKQSVVVPYIEEQHDRVISRYHCGYFNNMRTGEWIVPCAYSDDDVIVRDIIL